MLKSEMPIDIGRFLLVTYIEKEALDELAAHFL